MTDKIMIKATLEELKNGNFLQHDDGTIVWAYDIDNQGAFTFSKSWSEWYYYLTSDEIKKEYYIITDKDEIKKQALSMLKDLDLTIEYIEWGIGDVWNDGEYIDTDELLDWHKINIEHEELIEMTRVSNDFEDTTEGRLLALNRYREGYQNGVELFEGLKRLSNGLEIKELDKNTIDYYLNFKSLDEFKDEHEKAIKVFYQKFKSRLKDVYFCSYNLETEQEIHTWEHTDFLTAMLLFLGYKDSFNFKVSDSDYSGYRAYKL